MPTPVRRLPPSPSKEHLRKQAKRRAREQQVPLADAQRRLATDYGYRTWPALMRAVDAMAPRSAASLGIEDIGASHLSPLSQAASQADETAVRALLAAGELVDGRNGETYTPLLHACRSDAPAAQRLAVVATLLQAGVAVRATRAGNVTAMHAAAWRGPLALVELLIRNGGLSYPADETGLTPLDYARRGVARDKADIAELLDRPLIRDPMFRQAVQALHAGNRERLRRLLDEHPRLLRDRAAEPDCYPNDYFRDPKLFWFVANNPALMKVMPSNIVEIAGDMIARGVEPGDLDYTLMLVMTSGQAQGYQLPLMALLVRAGASATRQDILLALGHKEVRPVEVLLDSGTPLTAPIAAGLGRATDLEALLPTASADDRHAALSMAAINQHVACARLCLQAGADPNAFMAVHRHCTPLHTAAINDDVAMLELLVSHGARGDIHDTLWNATALDWAAFQKKENAEAYLRSLPPAA